MTESSETQVREFCPSSITVSFSDGKTETFHCEKYEGHDRDHSIELSWG